MAIKTVKYQVTGLAPLLMNNGEKADPLNPFSREIKKYTSKRAKTESDHEMIANLEWRGAVYLDKETGKLCIPWRMVEGAIFEAAKKQKSKKLAQAGIRCRKNALLNIGQDYTMEDLETNPNFRWTTIVRVNNARTTRTRPHFETWSCVIELEYMDDVLDVGQLDEIMSYAGANGFGDYRPRYGTFEAERI